MDPPNTPGKQMSSSPQSSSIKSKSPKFSIVTSKNGESPSTFQGISKKDSIKRSSYFKQKQKQIVAKASERQKFLKDNVGSINKIHSEIRKAKVTSADYYHFNSLKQSGLIESQLCPETISTNVNLYQPSKKPIKENDILKKIDQFSVENSLLKSQKIILEKELTIVKDNAQQLNRKYITDIQHYAEQEQKYKKIIENLEHSSKQLVKQLGIMQEIKQNLNLQESSRLQFEKQREYLQSQCQQFKNNYNQLFDNYTKLEVKCQGLEKQLVITKNYLTKVQSELHQKKEENFTLKIQLNDLSQHEPEERECNHIEEINQKLKIQLEEYEQLMNQVSIKVNSMKKQTSDSQAKNIQLQRKISETQNEKLNLLDVLKKTEEKLKHRQQIIDSLNAEKQKADEKIQQLSASLNLKINSNLSNQDMKNEKESCRSSRNSNQSQICLEKDYVKQSQEQKIIKEILSRKICENQILKLKILEEKRKAHISPSTIVQNHEQSSAQININKTENLQVQNQEQYENSPTLYASEEMKLAFYQGKCKELEEFMVKLADTLEKQRSYSRSMKRQNQKKAIQIMCLRKQCQCLTNECEQDNSFKEEKPQLSVPLVQPEALSQSYDSICTLIFSFKQKKEYLAQKIFSLMQTLIVANEIHNFQSKEVMYAEMQEFQQFIKEDKMLQLKLGEQLGHCSTMLAKMNVHKKMLKPEVILC